MRDEITAAADHFISEEARISQRSHIYRSPQIKIPEGSTDRPCGRQRGERHFLERREAGKVSAHQLASMQHMHFEADTREGLIPIGS